MPCCPVVRFFQADKESEDEDEVNSPLQTLPDILLILEPMEKTPPVYFMADAARLFKSSPKQAATQEAKAMRRLHRTTRLEVRFEFLN
jgi:hypothetical protein